MLTESLLLSFVGGIAGLALAFAFHRGLLALVANRIPVPRLEQVALDLPVLAFTFALAVGTGLLFGLIPALLAAASANDALREGGRHGASPRSRRALGALVIAEVALSLVLLAGAGLLIRSFLRLQSVSPGFDASGVLTARVQLAGRSLQRLTSFFGLLHGNGLDASVRCPVCKARRPSASCRSPVQALARASIAPIGRNQRPGKRRPPKCDRSRLSSFARCVFRC